MVLGIDIGGTNTEFAVVDSTKGIVHIEKMKTKSHNSFLNYIENFTDMVKDLTKKFLKLHLKRHLVFHVCLCG